MYLHSFGADDAVGVQPEAGADVVTAARAAFKSAPREVVLAGKVETVELQMEATEIARHRRAVANWEPPPRADDILTELRKPTPRVEYVVEDLAPSGSNVLLVAEAKAGKTTLIMNLVVAMVTGGKFLDRYAIDHLPEGTSITYSNYELEENQAKNWLRDMSIEGEPENHAHRLFVDPWKGYPTPLPAAHVEESIVELLISRNSSVWVIDPYGAAIAHDENSNDDTRAWTAAIDRIARKAGLSLVVIAAHSGSSSVGSGDLRVRGAYRLEDWMSVKWTYTHGGDVNEPPPDSCRYLSARGRDVAVPQFALDYEPQRRHLFVAAGALSKSANEAERWALRVYDAVFDHEHAARMKGEPPAPFKAGDLNSALDVSKTDSKPNGKGKALLGGRKLCVSRGWLIESDGPKNSKLYTVGPIDPRAKVAMAFRTRVGYPDADDADSGEGEAGADTVRADEKGGES